MHNSSGHGHGNGNGKRWLLIGLLVLGGFWLVNDAYKDGYTDALVQTGQAGTVRYYRGGPDFPWGLLILGGIGYIAWRKGAFDRLGGPGGPGQGNGAHGMQRYGAGSGFGGGFRGPRGVFEAWHRESHEAALARAAAPPAPSAPPAAPTSGPGNGHQQSAYTEATPAPTPPPPPPAPEYWAAMNPAAEASPPPSAPEGRGPESPVSASGATGPALERW